MKNRWMQAAPRVMSQYIEIMKVGGSLCLSTLFCSPPAGTCKGDFQIELATRLVVIH